MKIIYLHQYFNSRDMPGSTRSYEMARRLVERGHEVHIVTTDREAVPHGRKWRLEQIDGIYVHWLPVPYNNAFGHARRVASFFDFALHAAIKASSLKPDLVFASSTPLTVSLPGLVAAKWNRTPFVFEARDLWPELPIAVGALKNPLLRSLARGLESFTYRQASALIALSPGIAAGIKKKLRRTSPLHVIPNACDLDLFAPNEASAQDFRRQHPELGQGPILLYAGTLGRINKVSYLAHVAKHCLDRAGANGPRFVIMGQGAEVTEIKATARRLGVLGVNFFMYQAVSKADVVRAFQAASLGLSIFANVPQMENNSANKFFDTLASGTPVAINYGGWQADLIETWQAGLVLERDHGKAAASLLKFLGTPQVVKACAKNAQRLAESKFSRHHLADALACALEDAFRRSYAPPAMTRKWEAS